MNGIVVGKQEEVVASSVSFRAVKWELCLARQKAQREKIEMKTSCKTKKRGDGSALWTSR